MYSLRLRKINFLNMLNASKYWREAASIILAAKWNDSPQAVPDDLRHVGAVEKGYETHAGGFPSALPCDYNVLLLKRSSKSSFMPDLFVFPGGTIDKADFSDSWIDLFQRITNLGADRLAESVACKGARPPLISEKRESNLTADVAFRICAIREAFEESGVLLVTNKTKHHYNKCLSSSETKTVVSKRHGKALPLDIPALKLQVWRNKVHQDAFQFVNLCEELQVVPDIWSLVEWSNWLTPTRQKVEQPPAKPNRFDTIFYLCCMDHVPQVASDMKETDHSVWETPSSLLQQHKQKKLILAPPQVFEVSRLAIFPSIRDLCQYANKRAELGLECWYNVTAVCTDGMINLMPGDDLYPEDPDYEGTKEPVLRFDMTVAEARGVSRNIMRFEWNQDGDRDFVCNIDLKFGQIQNKFFSKI